MTNYGRIASQIDFDCSYAVSIAQNEEKVLVRMLNFSADRDFIVFRYILMHGLMKQKFRVKSDK